MDETTLCNMALGYIGADSIADIDNSRSANAEYCNTYLDTARDAALAAHNWNFARVRKSLAAISSEIPDDWSYAYTYPSDCVKMRRLLHTSRRTNTPHPFEIGLKSDKSAKVIFCDLSPASAIYTARIENLALWDDLAIEAFSYKLASLIVVPILRKPSAADTYNRIFLQKISMAEANDANEGQSDQPPESTFVEARL